MGEQGARPVFVRAARIVLCALAIACAPQEGRREPSAFGGAGGNPDADDDVDSDGSSGNDVTGATTTDDGSTDSSADSTTGGTDIDAMPLPGTASSAPCHQPFPAETAERAYDRDPATKFLAGGSSAWMRVDTGGPHVLTDYAITSADDAPERDPVRWVLLGSNDGTTWTELDVRVEVEWSARRERLVFAVDTDEPQRYYLLRMENATGPQLQLAELELFGHSALDDDSAAAPTPASSFTAVAVSRTRIRLAWSGGVDALARVERSDDGHAFTPIGYAARGTSNYTVDGVQPGTTAAFRVVIENGSGSAAASNVATATTPIPIALPTTVGWRFGEGPYALTVAYGTPVMPQAAFDRLVDEFFATYPAMASAYDSNAVREVQLTFDAAYDGVAYASGSEVVIASAYAAAHPDDVDVIAHEGFHLVQAYGGGDVPGWAVEGLADYARYAYGTRNAEACWTLQRYDVGQHYSDGYGVTARFLLWLESEAAPGITLRLDDTLRAGVYAESFWIDETGESIDALWATYTEATDLPPVVYE